MKQINIFYPASVSNVCCGFDVLGFSVDGIGDELTISKSKKNKITITKTSGFTVPSENNKNTASVAGQALLDHLGINGGFDIEINKKIKPGSGIGSSAASAVGAVFGINKLLGDPLKKEQLIQFAMMGEFVSSQSAPADNVASALHGGLILVNNHQNYEVVNLPVPKNLYAVVHHPLIEIKTSDSRVVLPKNVDLETASNQLSSIGGFIHSLHSLDFILMKSSLTDHLVEKYRAQHVPAFLEVKDTAMANGALCCSISGSGPSIFCLIKDSSQAYRIRTEIDKIYSRLGIKFNSYVTSLDSKGVHVI